MMDVLPIILYILGSILLIVLIILGIKLIITMDKIQNAVDNINTKVESLNGIFKAIDFATDKVNSFTNKAVDTIVTGLSKIFKRKTKKIELDEEDIDL